MHDTFTTKTTCEPCCPCREVTGHTETYSRGHLVEIYCHECGAVDTFPLDDEEGF